MEREGVDCIDGERLRGEGLTVLMGREGIDCIDGERGLTVLTGSGD